MQDFNLTLLQSALNAATLRQEAISSNIANVNTDNYKANQVEFESLLTNVLNGTGLTTTDEQHIGFSDAGDVQPVVTKRSGTTLKENGNNVDVDVEMANQAENSLMYNALVQQLNAQYSMLSTAINN